MFKKLNNWKVYKIHIGLHIYYILWNRIFRFWAFNSVGYAAGPGYSHPPGYASASELGDRLAEQEQRQQCSELWNCRHRAGRRSITSLPHCPVPLSSAGCRTISGRRIDDSLCVRCDHNRYRHRRLIHRLHRLIRRLLDILLQQFFSSLSGR